MSFLGRYYNGFGLMLAAGIGLCTANLAPAEPAWAPAPYELGQGLYFPELGLRVGGYADLQYYGVDHESGAVSIEDVSLFLTKDFGARWRVFSEIQLSEPLTYSDEGVHTNGSPVIERLYGDYFASTTATLRLGRFLTPIGEWNLVHAEPLVWTTSRPLTTSAAFSRIANGAQLYGTRTVAHEDLDYTLYVDDTHIADFANDPNLGYTSYGAARAPASLTNQFEHGVGGQLHYHLRPNLTLGTSLAWFQLKDPQQQYRLVGLDFDWQTSVVELSGESIYRSKGRSLPSEDGTPEAGPGNAASGEAGGPQGGQPGFPPGEDVGPEGGSNGPAPSEYGGFLQGVFPLPDHWYVVARYEHYRSAMPEVTANIEMLGINYRPVPGIVMKVERDAGTSKESIAPSGWLASFAILF